MEASGSIQYEDDYEEIEAKSCCSRDCCGAICRHHGYCHGIDAEMLVTSSPSDEGFESLDYDRCYSKAYKEEKLDTPPTKGHLFKVEVLLWFLTFAVGLVTGLVAFGMEVSAEFFTSWKFEVVAGHLDACNKTTCITEAYFMMCGFNVLFVFIAGILVWIEPASAGSGIPEIKCYLNGVRIPRMMRFKTLVCKTVGAVFSTSGGLFVGKEGPMIHNGSIIAAGLPQFRSFAFKWLDFNVKTFRTDRDKRDFVSSGAAAGVAAIGGAPIGGVLFSLEEGSSFWNQKLTWRTFFCAITSTFTLNFFSSGMAGFGWGSFFRPGMVNFGTFQCPGEGECHLWSAKDLWIFFVMAVGGGLLGALFNYLNMLINIVRLNYIKPSKIRRLLEVVLVGFVTTSVTFISAMTLGDCRPLGQHNVTETRAYFCEDGYYNDMATLFFNTQEVATKQLFHQEGTFSLLSLVIFFVFFYLLACWTIGIGVSSGAFVPSLLCGAAYGRFIATLLVQYGGYDAAYSGSLALLGSAAFLGGVVRMTLSLTVILIESTNEITYGLPIMIVLMIAKWVGDLFNEGLYDIHIELKNMPFLGWDHTPGIDSLTAKDVMKTQLTYIYPYTKAKSVYNILRNSTHNAFPVVTVKKTLSRSNSIAVTSNDRFRKQSVVTRMGEHQRRLDIGKRRATRFQGLQEESGSHSDNETPSTTPTLSRRRHRASAETYEVPTIPTSETMDSYQPLRFHGMMLRSHLTVLMHKHIFTTESALATDPVMELNQDQLFAEYPRFHDVDDMEEEDFADWMILDVTRYMNPCPYSVLPATPLSQVFHLFRSMGLRHLPVVNCEGEMVGIITRHDLTIEALEEAVEETSMEPVRDDRLHRRRATRARLFRKSLMNNSLEI